MKKLAIPKLTDKEKTLAGVSVLFVVLAVMDRLVLGPILSQMRLMDTEIDAKSQLIQRNVRILSFKEDISSEYAKYTDYFDSQAKTQEEIISSLLKEVEFLAKQKSINISNISPGDVTDNRLYQEYKTSVDCEGKLADILGFINLLEESNYLFQVRQYSLVPKSKGSEIMKCSIALTRIFITTTNQATPKSQVSEQAQKEAQEKKETE